MRKKYITKKLGVLIMAGMLSVSGMVSMTHASQWKVLEKTASSEAVKSKKLQTVIETYAYNFKTKDGKVYKEISFEYPKAEGSSDAAKAFNQFYQNLLSKWKKAAKENLKNAKEDFQARESDDVYYSDTVTCEITSNDENYISVLQTGYDFTMGAHGMPYRYSYIFDTKTGQKVSAAKILGISKSQLNKKVRSQYLKMFDQSEKTSGLPFYEDRREVAKELEKIDFNNNKYYLKNNKVRFYVDPYAVGPYASGFIETAIKL